MLDLITFPAVFAVFQKRGGMAFIQLPKAHGCFFMCLAGQEKKKLGVTFKHVKTKVKMEGERPFYAET